MKKIFRKRFLRVKFALNPSYEEIDYVYPAKSKEGQIERVYHLTNYFLISNLMIKKYCEAKGKDNDEMFDLFTDIQEYFF